AVRRRLFLLPCSGGIGVRQFDVVPWLVLFQWRGLAGVPGLSPLAVGRRRSGHVESFRRRGYRCVVTHFTGFDVRVDLVEGVFDIAGRVVVGEHVFRVVLDGLFGGLFRLVLDALFACVRLLQTLRLFRQVAEQFAQPPE